ncbi:MAG: hydroxyacid dehydrogenase [Firmicutes bacterium]|nr:hydroxyacid dehydrogenase [Bacillota bacterium]
MQVLVTGDVLVDKVVREFEEHDIAVIKKPATLNENELIEAVKNVDGYILGGNEKVTGRVVDAANKLRIIVFWGAQPSTFFTSDAMDKMKKRGIALETTGSSVNAVAEMTVFLIGAAIRNIPYLVGEVYKGNWSEMKGSEVKGKTVGIVGLGKIGQTVAKKLLGLELKEILYYDVRRNEDAEKELGVRFSDLQELLQKSDIVSLHLPLLPQTQGMIGKEQLSLMKPTAVLVNTARPQLVDGEALYEALNKGIIAKAIFDGYYVEGADYSLGAAGKLVTLPITKFWFTPHVAFNTHENDIEQSETAFNLMIQVLSEQSSVA